jgi:hypothetical protein
MLQLFIINQATKNTALALSLVFRTLLRHSILFTEMGNQLATDQRAMGMAVKAIAAMENIELDAAETLMTILRAPIKEKKEDPMESMYLP